VTEYPYGILPSPHFAGAVKQQPNLLRSGMSSGRSRVRRRFEAVPAQLKVEFRLKEDEAAFFDGWIEHALKGASAPFLLNIRLPIGLVQHQVEFVSSPLEDFKLRGGKWVYSATIQIKRLSVINSDLVLLLAGLNLPLTEWPGLLDAVELTVNHNNF